MIRATVIGGVFFLIPLAFIMIALGKAYELGLKVAAPLDAAIPVDSVGGVAFANILAVTVLLLLCLLASLIARVGIVRQQIDKVDGLLIEIVPGYAVTKSSLHGVAGEVGSDEPLKPVIVTFDDHKAVAFEVERVADGVIVFLPGAPSAWSGSTAIVEPARVRSLDLTVTQTTKLLRVLGRGTKSVLADTIAAGPEHPASP